MGSPASPRGPPTRPRSGGSGLTAQAVAGTELDLDGIMAKVKSGVRLAYGAETDTVVDRDTSIIDVAFALARAGKSVAAAAEVLEASGRADDEYLWSAVSEARGATRRSRRRRRDLHVADTQPQTRLQRRLQRGSGQGGGGATGR